MHFHDEGICVKCRALREYSTPIAHVLVLASLCQNCAGMYMIGWRSNSLCKECVFQLKLRELANENREEEETPSR